MAIPFKPKLKATSIHFSISLLLFATIASWIYFKLYPSFYFQMSGGIQGLSLMFVVDVVLGPILTFLVFNPQKSKREIYVDLSFVALVQLCALVYGLHIVYKERPQWLVIYQYGTATIVSAREAEEDIQLKHLQTNQFPQIESVPVVVYRANNNKGEYVNPKMALKELNQASKMATTAIQNKEEQNTLSNISKQSSSPVWVLAVMGKYTGAYVITNTQWQYLGKLGEKPVS